MIDFKLIQLMLRDQTIPREHVARNVHFLKIAIARAEAAIKKRYDTHGDPCWEGWCECPACMQDLYVERLEAKLKRQRFELDRLQKKLNKKKDR